MEATRIYRGLSQHGNRGNEKTMVKEVKSHKSQSDFIIIHNKIIEVQLPKLSLFFHFLIFNVSC